MSDEIKIRPEHRQQPDLRWGRGSPGADFMHFHCIMLYELPTVVCEDCGTINRIELPIPKGTILLCRDCGSENLAPEGVDDE
jgi:hypothetical protein